ncbi:MAG: ribosome maturation factor RimM [Deinococcales bacterium]
MLGRPFQLEGGLRLSWTGAAEPPALDHVERVFVVGFGPAQLRAVRHHGEALLLYLEGVRDREAARRLTGAEVFVPAAALGASGEAHPGAPAADALVGAPVFVDGREVGRVREVRGAAANPLLAVDTPAGEVLLPLTAPYVVAAPGRVELVDPPEGLLDTR